MTLRAVKRLAIISAAAALTFSPWATAIPAAVDHFVLTGPAVVAPGALFSLAVSAEDALGGVLTDFIGTVHFASSDVFSSLPADFTFGSTDSGVHLFSGMKLETLGVQSISANDTALPSASGSLLVSVANVVVSDPEPGTLALVGAGVMGLVATRRRTEQSLRAARQ